MLTKHTTLGLILYLQKMLEYFFQYYLNVSQILMVTIHANFDIFCTFKSCLSISQIMLKYYFNTQIYIEYLCCHTTLDLYNKLFELLTEESQLQPKCYNVKKLAQSLLFNYRCPH